MGNRSDKTSAILPPFGWNAERSAAAIGLAEGKTQREVAEEAGITDRTIRLWLAEPEFAAEVDRLSLMIGIASRSERLRIAMRVARQKVRADGVIETDRDLLDWLKFAQSETDGIKLALTQLAAVSENDSFMAAGRPNGTSGDEKLLN